MIPVYMSQAYLASIATTMIHMHLAEIGKEHLSPADWGIGIDNGKIMMRVYFPRNTVSTAMNSVHFDYAKAMHYLEQPIS